MAQKIENDTDIYRKRRIEQHSPEHVIPAGLGCDLEVIGMIDSRTNSVFGGTIDKHFTEDFALIRAQLGLQTRRGDSIKVESAGQFDLKGDTPVEKHDVKSGPPWKVLSHPDGRSEISISADSLERAVELARHAIRAVGAEGSEPVDIRAKVVSKFIPAMPFELGLGGPTHFRAIAKCSANFLCLQMGAKTVLEDQFDEIREYILSGVDSFDQLRAGGDDPWPCIACFDFRKEFVEAISTLPALGSLDHRIVIQGLKSTRTIYAGVQLFGHLPYSILISKTWNGPDFCTSLIADPVPGGKKHIVQPLNPNSLPNFSSDQVLAHSMDSEAFRNSAESIFKSIGPIVEKRITDDISTQALKTVLGSPDGKPITREQMNRLANEVATRFFKQLYRIDSETPLPPPDI